MARSSKRFVPVTPESSRPPRAVRVAEQLRQELSVLILTELKDPRLGAHTASVSKVDLSSDLRNADVYISALGNDEERHKVLTAVTHAEGFLHNQLRDRLENLRYVPKLRFKLDESIGYSVHISSLLRELAETDSKEK